VQVRRGAQQAAARGERKALPVGLEVALHLALGG
jgi:hypothetical protein